jgi:hypothetical protein
MIRRVSITLMALTMLSTLMTSLPATVFAANVGNTAPYPPNSQPTSSSSAKGEHVFFIRKNPDAGKQKDIKFSAYLPAGANIAGARLLLNPGSSSSATNVCEMNGPLGDNNRAIRVTIREPTSGATAEYYIRLANVCAQANQNNIPGVVGTNVLYARYPFPNSAPPVEVKTNMHRFDVTIEYGTSTPASAGGIRIVTSIPSNAGGLISPGTHGGSQVYAFPTVGDWDDIDPAIAGNPKGLHNMVVPFGLCDASNTPIAKTIGLYDADNGPASAFAPAVVRFKVRDLTTNSWVSFSNPVRASLEDGGETVRPADGTNDDYTSADFSLIPSHYYEMHISRINLVNTIDIQIPQGSQSIWGDPNVCQFLPPPPVYDQVTLESGISYSGDVEVGGSVTFNQNVTVSNFPWRPSQWGFNEEAIRVAWNTNTPPVQTNYDANNAGPTGLSGSAERQCQSGWAANCANYTCHNGSIRTAATGCGAGVGYYRWRCEWNAKYEPATGWVNQATAPACGNIIQYQCRDAAGTWQNQFRDFSGRANNACSNMWNCWAPSGRPNTFDPSYGAGYCRVFRCAYDPNPANYFYSPPGNNADDQCDKRCSAGTGAPAPNWTGTGSDDNCYIQPSFTVTCTFDTGVSVSEVVTNNGIFCDGFPNSSIAKSGASRGQLCAVTTASNSPWQGTPPGKGINGDVNQMRVIWNFNLITPASTCAQVGQRPYFHVYGGDVNAKTSFMPCTAPNTTTIQAWNTGVAPNYAGSGAQLAALARGTIDGFTSSSVGTQKPTGLSFANTTSGYGGGFMGTLDCIPDTDLPPTGASTSVSGAVAGQDWRNYGNQDVYITGDITYPANFSINAIPSLKIITSGNIYIASTVRQVSGTFIAKGKIYTCAVANGVGGLRAPTPAEMARPVTEPENCESTLQVNGSFIANQVKLLRTIGSVGYAPVDARTGTGLGAAAELFNYTPDVWLRELTDPTPGGGDLPTESFVNLPPIL